MNAKEDVNFADLKNVSTKAAVVSADEKNISTEPAVKLEEELKFGLKKRLVPNCREERMKLITNVTEILKCSNATLIRYLGRLGYTCCYCNNEYPDPVDLKKHTLESHSEDNSSVYVKKLNSSQCYVKVDITELQCKICFRTIDTLDELMCHLREEHEKKLYMDIKDYMVPFKFESDILKCFMCLNKFYGFKALLEHMNVHCRNFVCKLCDVGFITRTGLVNHSKSHEMGAFSCQFCEKVFTTQPRKRAHERYAHVCDSVYKCGHCNQSFRYYHQKNNHLLEVHGIARKVLKCNACDRTFTSQRGYRNHTKRDHLMERKFKCLLCDMKFYRRHELNGHMVKHTGVRKFQCDICLKSYGRKSTLREHIRIHVDDRRFKCAHCGMTFVQKCSWRAHVRAKHGEYV